MYTYQIVTIALVALIVSTLIWLAIRSEYRDRGIARVKSEYIAMLASWGYPTHLALQCYYQYQRYLADTSRTHSPASVMDHYARITGNVTLSTPMVRTIKLDLVRTEYVPYGWDKI